MRRKNKKIATICVALLISILVLTGCKCEHEWQGATCTSSAVCAKCGETEGMALGHDWKEATCEEATWCRICGKTEGEALGHEWYDATYSAPKTCKICGDTEGTCLKRAEAYSSAGAITAIKECLNFVPDCNLTLHNESSNSYSIKNNGNLVGIIGIDIDDWDAISLIDPDKADALLYHEQMSIAILLSSDSDMTYEEAKAYFEEAEDEGLIWINGYTAYVSEGMEQGMYAFGIGY